MTTTTYADLITLRQRIATAQIVAMVVTRVAPTVRETFYALGRTY